jgi:hypothetical protein
VEDDLAVQNSAKPTLGVWGLAPKESFVTMFLMMTNLYRIVYVSLSLMFYDFTSDLSAASDFVNDLFGQWDFRIIALFFVLWHVDVEA